MKNNKLNELKEQVKKLKIEDKEICKELDIIYKNHETQEKLINKKLYKVIDKIDKLTEQIDKIELQTKQGKYTKEQIEAATKLLKECGYSIVLI